MTGWVVGGTVRDLLLRGPARDLKSALAVPIDALRLAEGGFADALGAAFSTGIPRVTCQQHGAGEPDGGQTYVDVAMLHGPALADDLRLRDFTLNTLALDIQAPTAGVISVTGGVVDLQRRILRVASEYSFETIRCVLSRACAWR